MTDRLQQLGAAIQAAESELDHQGRVVAGALRELRECEAAYDEAYQTYWDAKRDYEVEYAAELEK